MNKVSKKTNEYKPSRFYLEGIWSGYTSAQRRVCHRTLVKAALVERYEGLSSITFSDGTTLELSLRPLKKGERATDLKNGYNTLIEDCLYYKVDSVVELNKIKNQPQLKFYFTFGSSESQAHQGGWVVIKAKDYNDARSLFIAKYGLAKDGCAPFSFQYSEEDFKTTEMYKQDSNLGHGEWND